MKNILSDISIKKLIILAAAIILIIAAVYFFMPRSLYSVASCPDTGESISIKNFTGGFSDTATEYMTLTGEDADRFMELISETKVYINPFFKKMNEGGDKTVGKNIVFNVKRRAGTQAPKNIYVFTEDILIVDGAQYRIYGNAFMDSFLEIINE